MNDAASSSPPTSPFFSSPLCATSPSPSASLLFSFGFRSPDSAPPLPLPPSPFACFHLAPFLISVFLYSLFCFPSFSLPFPLCLPPPYFLFSLFLASLSSFLPLFPFFFSLPIFPLSLPPLSFLLSLPFSLYLFPPSLLLFFLRLPLLRLSPYLPLSLLSPLHPNEWEGKRERIGEGGGAR